MDGPFICIMSGKEFGISLGIIENGYNDSEKLLLLTFAL